MGSLLAIFLVRIYKLECFTWKTPLLELLLGELKIKILMVFSVFDYQAVSKNMSWFTEMSNFLADAIITSFCCNQLFIFIHINQECKQ